MADDVTTKLILEVQGQEQAAELRKEAEALREQMLKFGSAASATDPGLRLLAKNLKAAEEKADELEKKFGRAKSGMQGMGMAALQGSRALQDFTQGGIGGVLNNVEGLAMALGGGTGLAGIATGVGVAFYLAKPYIGKFLEGLSGDKVADFRTGLEKLREEVKEMAKEPIKTVFDLEVRRAKEKELKETEKNVAAGEGVLATPDRMEAAVGKRTAAAITEPGGGEMTQATLRGQIQGESEDAIRGKAETRIADLEAQIHRVAETMDEGAAASIDAYKRMQAQIRAQMRADLANAQEDADKEVKELVGRATGSGPDQAKARAELVRRLRGTPGMEDKADAIERAATDVADEAWKALFDGMAHATAAAAERAGKEAEESRKRVAKAAEAGRIFGGAVVGGVMNEAPVKDTNAEAAQAHTLAENARRLKEMAQGQSTQAIGEVRMGEASGLENPATQMFAGAQQSALTRALRSPAARRRFDRMTYDEREQFVGGVNSKAMADADPMVRKQTAQALMRNGFTRNRRKAYATADRIVNEARSNVKEANADPTAKAADENTKALSTLTQELSALNRNGIRTKLK